MKVCKLCNHVLDEESRQWRKQIYCSVVCRKKAHRKKVSEDLRVVRKRANLKQNDEMIYLIKQCRRAGTVQILHGHDINSFIETMQLIRNRPKGEVELCHIAPVKGLYTLGLLHCENLFYGGKYQNRRFGCCYYSGGLSLHRMYLNPRWGVFETATNNDVLLLIEAYLKDIIPSYLKVAPVRKSSKVRVINKILEVDGRQGFDELILRDLKSLEETWCALSSQSKVSWCSNKESKYMAYLDGLVRFSRYGRRRGRDLDRLIPIMVIAYMALERVLPSKTYNKYFYVEYEPLIDIKYAQAVLKHPESWSAFKDMIYNLAFDTLQGKKFNCNVIRKSIFSHLNFPQKATLYYGDYGLTFS